MKENFRLLIHHHNIAYLDREGAIWLSSWIGRWVNSLAEYYSGIGLLLHQSLEHLPQQDTRITNDNVHLFSLGPSGKVVDRFQRMRRIKKACSQAGEQADGLLIRGITPRQHTVWKSTPLENKAFLLVGSLNNRRKLTLSPNQLLKYAFMQHRRGEFHKMAARGTTLLANSPGLVTELYERFGYQAQFVPTNSVCRDEFIPLEVRPVTLPWKLLYCGRLDFEKGLRELFQAVAALRDQAVQVHLDILSSTNNAIYPQLLELSDTLGISNDIHWHGLIPYGPELFGFYQSADVLVLPSYSEGFPIVIWEAAANCCPVIATSVGGIPDLWEDGKHGLLIPPKDVDAIVKAIKLLLCDASLRSRLVANAYQHASEFTAEECARRLACTLAEQWSENAEVLRPPSL